MIIVDTIRHIAAAPPAAPTPEGAGAAAPARIETTSGETALVDAESRIGRVWLTILDERQRTGEPAFLDVDEESRRLEQVLVPIVVRVSGLVNREAAVEVELEISHARHYLNRSHPDFARLLELLEQAKRDERPLLVTENDETHEIIDVREARGIRLPKPSAAQPEAPRAPGGITLQRAQEMFDLAGAQSCAPLDPEDPCIPFLYPDDGCWGRAHEMVRLITQAGVDVMKIWIYGNLQVITNHSPLCSVSWGYHVAPTVLVEDNNMSTVYVIDPSIFAGPVPELDWKNIQGDPQAVAEATEGRVFYRAASGDVTYDDDFSQTIAVLRTYRQKLQLRSVGPAGPPPYPCP